MSALVMSCFKAEKHPYDDNLHVYLFRCNENEYQVVANMENVYQVGDLVDIILPGSNLKNGERLSVRTIKGVCSNGMAMGLADTPLGADVSDRYCLERKVCFAKWPSIGNFFNVRSSLNIVNYRAKIKLHGTNSAIHLDPHRGICQAQSRIRLITPNEDNQGFASWVATHSHELLASVKKPVILFGEWAGPGIQSNVAISEIPERIFAIFAVLQMNDKFVYDPSAISSIYNPIDPEALKQIHILPWASEPIKLDYSAGKLELRSQLEPINQLVDSIEKCDPWVEATFGIHGIGEGVVMYPILDLHVNRDIFARHVFKAKGKTHQVVKTRRPAQIDPEIAQSIDAFVELFTTDGRLEQIAQQVNLPDRQFDFSLTGKFTKDFAADVEKESTAELENSGLVWKDVASKVAAKASAWWRTRSNASHP